MRKIRPARWTYIPGTIVGAVVFFAGLVAAIGWNVWVGLYLCAVGGVAAGAGIIGLVLNPHTAEIDFDEDDSG